MAKAQAETPPEAKAHKYFEDQFDDEEVMYVFRRHPIVMRWGLILGMGARLIGPFYTLILTFVYADDPSKYPSMAFFGLSFLISVGIGMLILFPSWLGWYFSVYIMTDQRFIQITQKGFFNKAVSDIQLFQIQSINYEVKGMEQTLLGFGTILIQTYLGDLIIRDVHHPAKTARKIQLIMRDLGVQPLQKPIVGEDVEFDQVV